MIKLTLFLSCLVILLVGCSDGRPYSNVECSINGIHKVYKHVKVHYAAQSWADDIWFNDNGVSVLTNQRNCIIETIDE